MDAVVVLAVLGRAFSPGRLESIATRMLGGNRCFELVAFSIQASQLRELRALRAEWMVGSLANMIGVWGLVQFPVQSDRGCGLRSL